MLPWEKTVVPVVSGFTFFEPHSGQERLFDMKKLCGGSWYCVFLFYSDFIDVVCSCEDVADGFYLVTVFSYYSALVFA